MDGFELFAVYIKVHSYYPSPEKCLFGVIPGKTIEETFPMKLSIAAVVGSSLQFPKSVNHKWLLKTNTNDPMTFANNKTPMMPQTPLCFVDH